MAASVPLWLYILPIHCWLFYHVNTFNASAFVKDGCDVNKKFQSLDADFIIAGFVPAHTLSNNGKYEANYPSVIWASALAFAVEELNGNENILPGIILGYDIRDSCNNNELATKLSLDIVLDTSYLKPKIDVSLVGHKICVNKNGSRSVILGVVGGASSSISTVISNILSTDYIPQVSYSATSTALSDRTLYRSFFRTVPSDVNQAAAVTELLYHFNWTYVSAFASDDAYGRLGLDELRLRSKVMGICFATDKVFNPNLVNAGIEVTDIISSLRKFNASHHVVILWCQHNDADTIIESAGKAGITRVTWIVTETWGSRKTRLKEGNNLIAMKLYQPKIPRFLTLFRSPSYACSNPWYKSIAPFACYYPLANLIPENKYPQVIASVYSLAYGLHNTLGCTKHACPRNFTSLDYKLLYGNITKLDFVVTDTDYRVKFNADGESAIVSYDYVFLQNDSHYKTFGHWTSAGKLRINYSVVASLPWSSIQIPISRCSDSCRPGQYRINGSSGCCWHCAFCTGNEVSTTWNQDNCKMCSFKQMANVNHTGCVILKQLRLTVDSNIGIFIIVVSLLGALLTLFVIFVFIKFWDTPMIKASSREMSCVQLISILLLFLLPVLYLVELTLPICICRTLFFGFLFTTVIAIIVIKTYRLLRVFSERFTVVSRFLHNKYQILFSYVLVMVQGVGTMLWDIYYPTELVDVINEKEHTYFTTCGDHQQVLFWIIAAYVFILAVVSGYMAFKARKLPENFNETQFICYAMFTACVLWMCFVPLFVSLSAVDLLVAFLSINYASTLSILIILYGYKIRIVLLLPRLNSPEHFRNTSAAATVTNFIRDVQRNDGTTRQRYQSVVTFDTDRVDQPVSSPLSRKLTVSSVDIPSHEQDELISSPRRRASYSGIGETEKESIDYIPLDVFRSNLMDTKRSFSTPLLNEEGSNEKRSVWRPSSVLFGKMLSATSINRMIADKNSRSELKALLRPETRI